MGLEPAVANWSVPYLSGLHLTLISNRMLEFYTSGCPGEGDSGSSIGVTAGEAGEKLWCISTDSAHNVVATGITADKMEVTLFADKSCSDPVTTFDTDGCKVIPQNVSVA